MRLNGKEVEAKLMATDYIDSELIDLNFDNSKHLVTMRYKGLDENQIDARDYTILFKDCFSATFNTWLEGMEVNVPQSPHESSFFFYNISIRGIEINGVQLYKCTLVIPMMDCLITCKSIAIVRN